MKFQLGSNSRDLDLEITIDGGAAQIIPGSDDGFTRALKDNSRAYDLMTIVNYPPLKKWGLPGQYS